MNGAERKSRPGPEAGGLVARTSRRAIIVLGMHRSGTSAVARVLGLCGGALPREALPADEHNETGYWEPAAVVRLHDELLSASGSLFHDVAAPSPRWHDSELASAYGRRLGEALEQAYGDRPLWVVKDPRLCRLVPLWRRVLGELKVEFLPVIPVRNPVEVAASLGRRDGFSQSKCLLLWLRHFLEAEAATRGLPRTFVLYESLLRDWRGVVSKVGRDLAIEWPRAIESAAPEIERFLDATLRHHVSSAGDLTSRSDISPWVVRAYQWAVAAAEGETAPTSTPDEVRQTLAAADQVFSPLLEDWTQDRLRLTERLSRIPQLMAEIQELRRTMERTAEESRRLQRELTAQAGRSEELESARAQLEATLESRQARHDADLASRQKQHQAELEVTRAAFRRDVQEASRRWLQARRELHSIHTRLSWTLSKPLRWAEGLGGDLVQDLGVVLRCCRRRPQNPLRLWRHLRLLRGSGLLDEGWYLERNPDVAASSMDAVTHYLCHGAAEGRDPSPSFRTAWYLERHPDVAASRLNPLLHYALHGAAEGRELPPPSTPPSPDPTTET